MRCNSRFLLWGIALLSVASVFPSALPADPPEKSAEATADQGTVDQGTVDQGTGDQGAAKTDRSLREQNIYIPYEKLRQVFEKHGRGVFLPYEKFEELWQAAQDKTRPAAEPKPPVGALITEIANEATVSKDVVQVQAVVKIDLLAPGWHEVGLRLADAAITSAKIGTETARILGGGGEDYRLLVEKKGKQPESIELKLEYAKGIVRAPGENSVTFQTPQAPVSRWQVRIPQAGVKVNLSPLIAATEVPAVDEKKVDEKKGGEKKGDGSKAAPKREETVVLAFVGAAPMVRIDWTAKAEGATGLAALASVEAQQQLIISEGMTHLRATLAYTISRAELGQLVIDVPADYKVVNVFDPNVRQWSVEAAHAATGKAAAVQTITAQLFEPAKTTQQVTVELEKLNEEPAREALKAPAAKPAPKPLGAPVVKAQDWNADFTFTGNRPQTLAVPVVKAQGVARQQGVLVVQVAAGLRAEATRTTGLLQVDQNELPAPLSAAHWSYAYRYASVPYELEFSAEHVEPRITSDSLVEAYLEPERLTLDVTTIYNVERAGIFKLEFHVPAGYQVRQVRGGSLLGAAEVQVDSHQLEGEKKDRLVVNLGRRAMGRVALAFRLQKELQEPNLLTPTGKKSELAWDVPQVLSGSVEHAAGRLLLCAPESLTINPGKLEGLRSVSFKEAFEGIASGSVWPKPAETHPLLAFAFTQDPAALALDAQRRKPQVTVYQLLVGRIDEGVVKYQATFDYSVLYSGVKSLRIDVPKEVSASLRNHTAAVRDKIIDPQPADVAKGYVAWSFAGENEFFGPTALNLGWEKQIEKLNVGHGTELAVPSLLPRDVDRAWGRVVLAKAEMLDLQESGDTPGLRPIDPQHDLPQEVPGAARAWEFHGQWKLPIAVTRYELQEVKRTSIDRALVRMVVTPADQVAVQALYRVQSVRQRLPLVLPAGATFDADPLRINDQSVTPERGKEGQYYVPLLSTHADKPFLLELRYTLPGDGRQLDLPSFPGPGEKSSPDEKSDETAMQQVYLAVFLPQTRTLLGSTGPWSEEFRWCREGLMWQPVGNQDDKKLWRETRAGTETNQQVADTFPTDGSLYLFSTLRPADAPQGSLHLVTTDRSQLHVMLFVLLVAGGLVLLRARACRRLMAIGLLLVVLLLAGVFAPTFSYQVLNGVLAAAIVLVALTWLVVYAARRRACGTGSASVAPCATTAPPPSSSTGSASEEAEEDTGEASATQPTAPEPPSAAPGSEGGPSHA